MKQKKGRSCFLWFLGLLMLFTLLPLAGLAEGDPKEILNDTDPYILPLEYVGLIPRIDEDFWILQGGCVSGDYGWFATIGAKNSSFYQWTECYIRKYDIRTMEEIARSEKLLLGHANDITYRPDTNELYVLHVYQMKVTVLDADTLAVKGEKRMQYEAHSLSYVPSSQRFVATITTSLMNCYDKDFEKTVDYAFGPANTLVSQGIYADEKYVYHVLYSPKSNTIEPDNIIHVMDYEGNLITKIPIGLKGMEPENISLVDDTFYIAFNVSREAAQLYKGTLVPVE
ncbi:MAG: hypothetical protein E7324_04975 [Clostridiales bacterium]|nr:hypothetical protein [Clostridiales bacterium]